MDVSLLEEQYDFIKQKQKLQPHIIVFKTDEDSIHGEPMVSAVLINKKVRKSKAFQERTPVREVNLELPCNGNVQDNSPWRTHLEIHRLVHSKHQKAPYDLAKCKNEQISFDNKRLTLKENVTSQYENSVMESEQSTQSLDELENSSMLSSPTEEAARSTSGLGRNSPLESLSSANWTHQQVSSVKCIPGSNKLTYYPFPQKKTPRISETARRLGLYVSQ
uniref:TBC1 domain-containing protein n=1 Tax=Sphenodon punctatus TaxID=8508 RepID=A0A8D0HGD5_SPHPU